MNIIYISKIFKISLLRRINTSKFFCQNAIISQENIVSSPVPSLFVPKITIYEYLFQHIDHWSNKTAAVCAETGKKYTFDEYRKLSENLSKAFYARLGLRKGDVIVTILPNVTEYLTIFLGAFRNGIVVAPVNAMYTSDEIARQLNECTVKIVITSVQNHKLAQAAIKKLKTNIPIPIVTVKHQKTDVTPEGAIDFQELCEYNGPQVKTDKPAHDDLAIILFSSGTTGLPKGVKLLHHNIVTNLCQIQHESFNYNRKTTINNQDIIPAVIPFFHAYGIVYILFNLFSLGCKVIILPKYSLDLYLNVLKRYPCNSLVLVPPLVLMLINNQSITKKHFEHLTNVLCGAAPLSSTDIDRFYEKFGDHYHFYQGYGLTEAGPVSLLPSKDLPYIRGSVGVNIPLQESRIIPIDNSRKTNLGPNQDGHLLIRSPNIMDGYLNNPKATNDMIDKDGWIKTGDIAHFDENGAFYITDRLKELIKVKGLQVAPAELEALIRNHSEVEDVGVIGVPHPQHGEVPKAFVVLRKGSSLKSEHIQEYVKENSAKHKHLNGGVIFVDAIPKSASGKILRRVLREF